MVRPFGEVWAQAEKIWGLVLEKETRLLYEAAVACGPGARFLEVGSLCGRSASVLGMVAMDNGGYLTCVDDFSFVHRIGGSCINRILENLKRCGVRVTMMMMTSGQAWRQCRTAFDLVHIDGNHTYKAVKLDCNLWLPQLLAGGLAAFHDYNPIPGRPAHHGVKRAVDEATQKGYTHYGTAGRMEVLRKL